MEIFFRSSLLLTILVFPVYMGDVIYPIDDTHGEGRMFDGIGAISGGGATSKLLVNYPEPQRSQVLDYLFKPNFGASLHILKVEIGGDAQSTEGTECSHMHDEWEENYTRGYEWFMMKEAKKRNPSIKLYGLPWGFPGWVGGGEYWPFHQPNVTANYIVNWINGAKVHHGLDIDYIGLWNEKPYQISYVLALRSELDSRGFHSVQIVAADMLGPNAWDIVQDLKFKNFNKSVAILGAHYIGTSTPHSAKASHKPLWSSEDYSTTNDVRGGGCMARIINQNYVNGLVTSTIAWNLIASYYDNLPIRDHGLMTANEPWSGYYKVVPPIWGTAHTTQFSSPGWHYLAHGSGVGWLKHGGSYVSLMSPDRKQLTIVIETLDTKKHEFCLRPPQLAYSTEDQNVTLALEGSFANLTMINLWVSHLITSPESYFINKGPIKIYNGKLHLFLQANSIYTLSTVSTAKKGSFDHVPASRPFPLPYKDNFEDYPINSEAYNFAQQVGAFEVRSFKGSKVLQQVVIHSPIYWCPLLMDQPITMIGNYNWSDITVQVDVRIPSTNGSRGVFIAAHVDQGGCRTLLAQGVYFWLLQNKQQVVISTDLARTQVSFSSAFPVQQDTWYHMELTIKGNHTTASVNNSQVFSQDIFMPTQHGFVALGTDNFGNTFYDNFSVS